MRKTKDDGDYRMSNLAYNKILMKILTINMGIGPKKTSGAKYLRRVWNGNCCAVITEREAAPIRETGQWNMVSIEDKQAEAEHGPFRPVQLQCPRVLLPCVVLQGTAAVRPRGNTYGSQAEQGRQIWKDLDSLWFSVSLLGLLCFLLFRVVSKTDASAGVDVSATGIRSHHRYGAEGYCGSRAWLSARMKKKSPEAIAVAAAGSCRRKRRL